MPVTLANAGLPMVIPQFLLMGLAFAPVVLFEAAVVRWSIRMPWKSALKDMAVANLWTTLAGIPLAWAVMVVVQLGSSPFFYPDLDNASPAQMLAVAAYESGWVWPHIEHRFWLVPLASMILLIPSFVVSFFLERWVLTKRWHGTPVKLVSQTVLRANIWSYLGMYMIWNIWFLSESHRQML